MKNQMSKHVVLPCLFPGKKVLSLRKRMQLHEMEIIRYCVYVCMGVRVGANVYLRTYDYVNVAVWVSVFVCTVPAQPTLKTVTWLCMTPSKLWVKTGISLWTPTKTWSSKYPPVFPLYIAVRMQISFIYYHLTATNPREPNLDFCIREL